MNVHAHISGQVPGHVPNQTAQQLPQRSGNPSSYPVQNFGPAVGATGTGTMDQELLSARKFVRERIFAHLVKRQQNNAGVQMEKIKEVVRRLEEGLLRLASSKEEYMNMETLGSRLASLISRTSSGNRQPPSSSATSTMIPTPGMPHSGNSNFSAASSLDATANVTNSVQTTPVASSAPSPNGSLPIRTLNKGDGLLSSGCQQASSHVSMGSGGHSMPLTSMQGMNCQMIPTPGFINNGSSQGLLHGDTTAVLHEHQKVHVGGHNFHGQSRGMVHSGLQQNSYASNGTLAGGFSMVGNNSQLSNGVGTSDNAIPYGDGYASISGSSMNSQSICKPNISLITSNSILKSNHQAAVPLRENLPSPHQQKRFQLASNLQQQPQQYLNQRQQMLKAQQHHQFIGSFGPSQVNHRRQLKQEPGVDPHVDVMQTQTSEHLQLSEFQNQFQQISTYDNSGAQTQHSVAASMPQNDNQMQRLLHTGQFVESISDLKNLTGGLPSESVPQGQWQPVLQEENTNKIPANSTFEQQIKEGFHQGVSGQEEAMRSNVYIEGCSGNFGSQGTARALLDNSSSRSVTTETEHSFFNQVKWLLFLRHAQHCTAPQGECQSAFCPFAQNLLRHMESCNLQQCPFPRCHRTKVLRHHYNCCVNQGCPVCTPVKNYVRKQQLKLLMPRNIASTSLDSVVGMCKPSNTEDNSAMVKEPTIDEKSDQLIPPQKRRKMDAQSQAIKIGSEKSAELVVFEHSVSQVVNQDHHIMPVEYTEMKTGASASSEHKSPFISESKCEAVDNVSDQNLHIETVGQSPKQSSYPLDREALQVKLDNSHHSEEPAAVTKSGKPKLIGVSLTELFTPEQVREHIKGLRQWVGQSRAKAEKNQAMGHSMNENSCQLCAVEKLNFEPPPLYCTPCGSRIKRNAMYYTGGAGDARHCFCIPCYNEARGDTIVADGTSIPKARLEKKKNDEETEEWWVQCDKCEAWQHQICALFNGRRNDGGEAEYTCPNCYIAEVERGERMPLPQSAVLGAKDLPTTILSDHIELRLARKLKEERQQRAKVQGKSYDEVPGAESLVVRVVSSVDKKLEVKQRILEIFQEHNYPTEFPYKSKVILLFQKIEGVEVCLFGMYVQEFGSECQFPNQRRVYLSYLDSVKYFRPDVKAVTGEALRTFVYHEILIGYLEYCKLRGFTSCYIWACPPLKGEDYILYCHPEIQKTPKSDKLREWYLSMLRKAVKENVVVDLTNLYDHFFTCDGECKAKVTATRLPYFDGDYWPGAAEELLHQIHQEEESRKQNKRGSVKKTISKRALKASGQTDLSGNASKDLLLMHKMGETISPMREDFIMVHLQHTCTHCRILMVSGTRWVCNQCKNFHICDICYASEQRREQRERHPMNHKETHPLHPIQITNVPEDTKDKDEIIESEFFDTRQAFLSLCQGNHYQYDTLRRAKHSSMMVLYHLHNPTAPAYITTCHACRLDIETGQGWRCEVCPEFEVCDNCYSNGIDHPHKLTHHPSMAERDAQNKEARQKRVSQLRVMLDLLIHASECRSAQCQYPNCRKVKGLFRHGLQCKRRVSGGCHLCKNMWHLLSHHARTCKESQCHVPRCRDLKEHIRRQQQQSDTRRRAAVMEMMRQRAAEVANNT
ncbi:hypothetical protein SAY86_014176 [Trapa natans]|uniref:histone acetyltransferase n=1 Tax=Trapa natans TaxID=22666 RepID=A0AAN7L038_TRANT|nr:hypothetical protein SAY86_014176 [Trapa natans]